MNPEGSEFQLPTPEVAPQQTGEHASPAQHEAAVSAPEKQTTPYSSQHQAPTAAPAATAPPIALPDHTAVPAAVGQPTDPAITTSNADDVDLIEKTWVHRAKKIVEQTKDDPFAQKNEISKVKAEYIQGRFGKKIKLADEHPPQ